MQSPASKSVHGLCRLPSCFHKVIIVENHVFWTRLSSTKYCLYPYLLYSETPMDWTVDPAEGSLMQREDTNFIVKFKPQGPGVIRGYLVIETEDFKKTYEVIGST
jgi:hypothetical protein